MFRIGIIGTENSHALAFAKLINLPGENGERLFPGAEVIGVYGPDLDSSGKIVQEARVPKIMDQPEAFLDQVDAMIITSRKGSLHYQYAMPFIEAGIPLFVDKPITSDPAQARQLVEAAERRGVLMTGGSGCKLAYDIQVLQGKVRALKTSGDFITASMNFAADPDSEYDGFYFYASHLTEMALTVFGYDVRSLAAFDKNGSRTCVLRYDGYDVTLHFTKGTHSSSAVLYAKSGNQIREIDISMIYQLEVEHFLEMLRTGKMPLSYVQLIAPVTMIAAIERSVTDSREICLN